MVGMLTGCSDLMGRLLSPEAPGTVEADDLDDPSAIPMLAAGAVADFECALSHYIVVGGLVGYELADAQQTAAQWDYDRRTFTPSSGWYATSTCNSRLGIYTPLSTAHWAATNVLDRLEAWGPEEVPNYDLHEATAAVYGAYSRLLFGEAFCSVALNGGPELTREETLGKATELFERAQQASVAAEAPDLLNMARVGHARALLNLGRAEEAAELARKVPEGFSIDAQYTSATTRSENNVFVMNIRSDYVTVDERFRNLTVEGQPDSRVQVVNTGQTGPNGQTVIWNQEKYPRAESPIPIARWEEAQLIIAEAEGGQDAVDIINDLRDRAGLAPFQSNDEDEILEQIIEERQREFFLEGHHLGDINRYGLDLHPAPQEPFVNGGVYGDRSCFPLPDIERNNNPNID